MALVLPEILPVNIGYAETPFTYMSKHDISLQFVCYQIQHIVDHHEDCNKILMLECIAVCNRNLEQIKKWRKQKSVAYHLFGRELDEWLYAMEKDSIRKMLPIIDEHYQRRAYQARLFKLQCEVVKNIYMPALLADQVTLIHLLQTDLTFRQVFQKKYELGQLSDWCHILNRSHTSLIQQVNDIEYLNSYMPTFVSAVAQEAVNHLPLTVAMDFFNKYSTCTLLPATDDSKVTPVFMCVTIVKAMFAGFQDRNDDGIDTLLRCAKGFLELKGGASFDKVRVAILEGLASLFAKKESAYRMMNSVPIMITLKEIILLLQTWRQASPQVKTSLEKFRSLCT